MGLSHGATDGNVFTPTTLNLPIEGTHSEVSNRIEN
jgi:hypothetical protein